VKITHTFSVTGVCPLNGDVDEYEVEITLGVMVEAIGLRKQTQALLDKPMYQEEFTALLQKLTEGRVKTTCDHRGVKTVVEVG
jgi:hypothetical protein